MASLAPRQSMRTLFTLAFCGTWTSQGNWDASRPRTWRRCGGEIPQLLREGLMPANLRRWTILFLLRSCPS
jgi:hypothetical protein